MIHLAKRIGVKCPECGGDILQLDSGWQTCENDCKLSPIQIIEIAEKQEGKTVEKQQLANDTEEEILSIPFICPNGGYTVTLQLKGECEFTGRILCHCGRVMLPKDVYEMRKENML